MADTLKIIKHGTDNFSMEPSNLQTERLQNNGGYWFFEGETFQVEKLNGGKLRDHLRVNVTVQDLTSGGTVESFTSTNTLAARLIQLKFLRQKDQVLLADDLISGDAANQLIIGTDGLLYVAAGGGGGGSPLITQTATATANTTQNFTLTTTGKSIKMVFVNRTKLYNDTEVSQAGDIVTIDFECFGGEVVELIYQ